MSPSSPTRCEVLECFRARYEYISQRRKTFLPLSVPVYPRCG